MDSAKELKSLEQFARTVRQLFADGSGYKVSVLEKLLESRDQELAARHAEANKALVKRWRTLAGSPDDWITTGDETGTAIRTAGRSTMIQCAEELEKL